MDLAAIQCTDEEIESVMGLSSAYLSHRAKVDSTFSDALKKGREKGRASLRRAQYLMAVGNITPDGEVIVPPHPTMQIWLGKQYLGQADRQEDIVHHRHSFVSGMSDKELAEVIRLEDLLREIGRAHV